MTRAEIVRELRTWIAGEPRPSKPWDCYLPLIQAATDLLEADGPTIEALSALAYDRGRADERALIKVALLEESKCVYLQPCDSDCEPCDGCKLRAMVERVLGGE